MDKCIDGTKGFQKGDLAIKYYVIKESGAAIGKWQSEQIVAEEPTFTRAYARLLELGPTGYFVAQRLDFNSITPVMVK